MVDKSQLAHPGKQLSILARKFHKKKSWIERIFLQEKDSLIDDHFLDNSQILNRYECIQIAKDLIDDQGRFSEKKKAHWLKQLEARDLSPGKRLDEPRKKWLLIALEQLQEKWLNSFHLPTHNRFALEVIRRSLMYSNAHHLTDADVKRAALSAYITDLRQTLGSCFATAPALYIRKYKPELFFKDLHELFYKAHLERVIEGEQYLIPLSLHLEQQAGKFPFFLQKTLPKKVMLLLCTIFTDLQVVHGGFLTQFFFIKRLVHVWVHKTGPTWTSIHQLIQKFIEWKVGHKISKPKEEVISSLLKIETGSLEDSAPYAQFEETYFTFCAYSSHPLLKVWEYTIASMSDVKQEFKFWNSFYALGFDSNDLGSIAANLFETATEKNQELETLIEEIQTQIEQTEMYLQSLNVRARTANFETMQQIKGRAASEHARLSRLVSERDAYYKRAQDLAEKIPEIARQIGQHFTKSFQEVFDPTIVKKHEDLFADSPAGFRLVYKHARQDPALWTNIETEEQYAQFLSHFFRQLTQDLKEDLSIYPKDLEDLMHSLSSHVNSQTFLLSAKMRSAKKAGFHKPHPTAEPWSYVSGGTMSMLLAVYFSKNQRPSEMTKNPKDSREMVDFLLEFILDAPFNLMEKMKQGKDVTFLMYSPTHAFTFDPTSNMFLKGIQSGQYPFSWIRDEMVGVAVERMKAYKLDGFAQSAFHSKFLSTLPVTLLSMMGGKLNVLPKVIDLTEMQENIAAHFPTSAPKPLKESFHDHLDYALFSFLPMFPSVIAAKTLEEVFSHLNWPKGKVFEEVHHELKEMSALDIFTKLEFMDVIQYVLALETQQIEVGFDAQFEMQKAFDELGLSLQTPFIFADTNWTREKFAFCVNPVSLKLELYRVSYTGAEGIPMRTWKRFFGMDNPIPWAIFDHPTEYGY